MTLRRRTAGFTLLEVMISIGILAVAMASLGSLNGSAVQMHAHARRLTIATQLARGAQLDLYERLRKDGLSSFSKEYHGDFAKEGEPDYKWRAVVVKPELDIDPQTLIQQATGSLGLGGDDDGNSDGGPAGSGSMMGSMIGSMAGPMAGMLGGMLDAQLRAMTELVKQSVREVRLTVTWPGRAGKEESFDVVEHIVVLPEARSQAASEAAPNATAGAASGNGLPFGPPLGTVAAPPTLPGVTR